VSNKQEADGVNLVRNRWRITLCEKNWEVCVLLSRRHSLL